MMSEVELRMLAKFIVEAASSDQSLLKKVSAMILKEDKDRVRLISARDAAHTLGISIHTLYRTKTYPDGRPVFSCVKRGNGQSSHLLYNANTLIQEYDAYLAWKRGLPLSEGRLLRS